MARGATGSAVSRALQDRVTATSPEAAGTVRDGLRRRFHTLVDTAELDEHRARDWVVVRMLHNALWELQDHPEEPDADYLTMCVTIAKAVQD